jgi:imidazolonepropionase-like amidohydrolase
MTSSLPSLARSVPPSQRHLPANDRSRWTMQTLPRLLFLCCALVALCGAPAVAQEGEQDLSIDIYYGSEPTENEVAFSGPKSIPSPPLAFRVGKLVTMEGPPIHDGVILTRDSKIIALGKASETAIPEGFEVYDFPELWAVPGLVDLHCHVGSPGMGDINDTVYPTNPEMRTLDLVLMDHEAFKNALAAGVTTVLYIPGSGSNAGGFGTLTKTWGHSPDEALVRFPGCLKIAQAGNPERRSGDFGLTRAGMNQGLRFMLERARAYHEAWEAYKNGEGEKPDFQADLEYLRGLFRHEYPVAVHTQIYQVALSTLRELRQEFGLWTVIVHGTFDAYRLSEVALELGVPVCNGPRQYHLDRETSQFIGNAAMWYAGGKHGFATEQRGLGRDGIGVNTDSPVIAQEQLTLQCAMAVRLGLPDEVGMRAMTINQARFVKIDDRVGSLKVGKDADIGFWTGDPIDPRSRVELTLVNGHVAYRRDPLRPRF